MQRERDYELTTRRLVLKPWGKWERWPDEAVVPQAGLYNLLVSLPNRTSLLLCDHTSKPLVITQADMIAPQWSKIFVIAHPQPPTRKHVQRPEAERDAVSRIQSERSSPISSASTVSRRWVQLTSVSSSVGGWEEIRRASMHALNCASPALNLNASLVGGDSYHCQRD